MFEGTYKQVKKAVVFVIGGTILLIGLALLVLPGPAIVVIPIGLFILASEFLWAKRLLDDFKRRVEQGKKKFNEFRK